MEDDHNKKKKREVKFNIKQELKEKRKDDRSKSLTLEIGHWRKKGKHSNGKQRWECSVCGFRTTEIDKIHKCS